MISEIIVDGKRCIKVEFTGDKTPYFAYGRAFMRVADEDRQLSVKQLKDLTPSTAMCGLYVYREFDHYRSARL